MDAAQRRCMPHEWRILEQGPEALTDIDLVASLLTRSSRRCGPEQIAARVLATGLSALRRASPGELLSIEGMRERSEEHTSELQSPCNLVCRLLLEKKKNDDKTDRDRYD